LIAALSGVKSPSLGTAVVNLVSKLEPDLLALCGDVNVSRSALKRLSRFKLVLVTGESDDIYYVKLAKELKALVDGKVVEVSSIRVGGVGAVNPAYDVQTLVSRSGGGNLDILISYFPPIRCLDISTSLYIRTGLGHLNTAIKILKPRVLLVGRSWKPTVSYCEGVLSIGLRECIALVKLPEVKLRFIPISLVSVN